MFTGSENANLKQDKNAMNLGVTVCTGILAKVQEFLDIYIWRDCIIYALGSVVRIPSLDATNILKGRKYSLYAVAISTFHVRELGQTHLGKSAI